MLQWQFYHCSASARVAQVHFETHQISCIMSWSVMFQASSLCYKFNHFEASNTYLLYPVITVWYHAQYTRPGEYFGGRRAFDTGRKKATTPSATNRPKSKILSSTNIWLRYDTAPFKVWKKKSYMCDSGMTVRVHSKAEEGCGRPIHILYLTVAYPERIILCIYDVWWILKNVRVN